MDGLSDSETDPDSWKAHRAAAQGEVKELIHAIKQDPGVLEQEDTDGYTPLGHAVKAQQMAALKRLVKIGANTNAQDGQGRTCLHIAAYQGWYEGVVYLLRKGARQNIPEKSGRTPLHASTYDKDIRIIGALLQTLSKEDVGHQDTEKMTALHWAAFHNRPEHVQLLLMSGADMYCQDVDGRTPLHWASQNGSVECVHIFIQCCKGPELVNQIDSSGKNALHYAAAAGHCLVLKDLASVQGCELEAEDPDDRTPLHWAAAMGHSHCVSALLALGVLPNPKDIEGGTPLEYARQTGHNECTRILEEKIGIKSLPNQNKKQKWRKSGGDSGQSRNPLGKLKDLFRSRNKKVSTTPTSDTTSDSYEMKSFKDKKSGSNYSKSEKSLRDGSVKSHSSNRSHRDHTREHNGGIEETNSSVAVPKIILSTFDDDSDEVLLKHRKKNRKQKKVLNSSTTVAEVHHYHLEFEGRNRSHQAIGVSSASSSHFLPPVMSPRVSPVPPIPINSHHLPVTPPASKTMEELAPLRVPMKQSYKKQPRHSKVVELQKERDGQSRSPTPPPPQMWPPGEHYIKSPAPSSLTSEESHRIRKSKKSSKSQKMTSPWLHVTSADHNDLLSVSSGQRSRLSSSSRSSVLSAHSDTSSMRLSPINPHYGQGALLAAPNSPQMSSIEKKTLDRTIQSLLH